MAVAVVAKMRTAEIMGYLAMVQDIVVHENPVWRGNADFLIRGKLNENEAPYWEQLWTKRVNDDEFMICCIPYFIYDLALGDTVRARELASGHYDLDQVIQRAGRFTFRVWFDKAPNSTSRTKLKKFLIENRHLAEWRTDNLVAVDAANSQCAQDLADFLHQCEKLGELIYETGKTT